MNINHAVKKEEIMWPIKSLPPPDRRSEHNKNRLDVYYAY